MRKLLFLNVLLFLIIFNANCLDYYSTRIKGMGRGLAMIVDDDLTKLGYNPAYINLLNPQINTSYTSINENGFGNIIYIQDLNSYKIGVFAEYSYEKDYGTIIGEMEEFDHFIRETHYIEIDKYRYLGDYYNFKFMLGRGNSAWQYQLIYQDGVNNPYLTAYEKSVQEPLTSERYDWSNISQEKVYDYHKTEQTHRLTFAKINEPMWKFQNYALDIWFNYQKNNNGYKKYLCKQRTSYMYNQETALRTVTESESMKNSYSTKGMGMGFKFSNRTSKKAGLEKVTAGSFRLQIIKSADYFYNKTKLTNFTTVNDTTGYYSDSFSYSEKEYDKMSEIKFANEYFWGYVLKPHKNLTIAYGLDFYFTIINQIRSKKYESHATDADKHTVGVFFPLGIELDLASWLTGRAGISYHAMGDRYYTEGVAESYEAAEFTFGFTAKIKEFELSASLSSDREVELPIIQTQFSYIF